MKHNAAGIGHERYPLVYGRYNETVVRNLLFGLNKLNRELDEITAPLMHLRQTSETLASPIGAGSNV